MHHPPHCGYRGYLEQWASKKGREEVELPQARTKMRDLRRGAVVEEAAGAVADGALPPAAAPKKKQERKGAGRGLRNEPHSPRSSSPGKTGEHALSTKGAPGGSAESPF